MPWNVGLLVIFFIFLFFAAGYFLCKVKNDSKDNAVENQILQYSFLQRQLNLATVKGTRSESKWPEFVDQALNELNGRGDGWRQYGDWVEEATFHPCLPGKYQAGWGVGGGVAGSIAVKSPNSISSHNIPLTRPFVY